MIRSNISGLINVGPDGFYEDGNDPSGPVHIVQQGQVLCGTNVKRQSHAMARSVCLRCQKQILVEELDKVEGKIKEGER